MNRYNSLITKARNGELILFDGATGTEAERRGVPQLKHAWNGGAALTHPKILQQIHQDYIKLGSKIIITNTFANTLHALEDANHDKDFYKINKMGLDIALNARKKMYKEDEVLVAGGISYWTWTGRYPSNNQLKKSIEEQSIIFSNGSADFIILEMMVDIERTLITLNAAKKSGLPIWVGLSCKANSKGDICLLEGEKLKEIAEILSKEKIEVINIMHTDMEYVLPSLKVLRSYWNGLIGVYPHSGSYTEIGYRNDTKWRFKSVISPDDFIKYTRIWIDFGINFIGGCCGINCNHIAKLSKIIK